MTQLVRARTPGHRRFYSQMRLDAPPRTNCRLLVAMMQLAYAGLAFPDPRRFLDRLRAATGVPERDRAGDAQGTSAADLLRALAQLLPWVHATADLVTDPALLSGLAAGRFTAGVAVPVYNSLPGRLSRWSPAFARGHMILLAGARSLDDVPEVLWIDPLGGAGYRGEWVRWSRVKPHLSQASGRVFATLIAKEAGLGTLITPDRTFPATATIPKGTACYVIDRRSLELRGSGEAAARVTARSDGTVAVRTLPARPPQGTFVHVVDGPLAGRYVRLDDVELKPAQGGGPVDVDAIRAAAIAEGRAQVEAELLAVDEPLFRRVVGSVA